MMIIPKAVILQFHGLVFGVEAVVMRLLQTTSKHVKTWKCERREPNYMYMQKQTSLVGNPLRKRRCVGYKVERRHHVMQEDITTSEKSATWAGRNSLGETRTE
jgi:hypothetical protein